MTLTITTETLTRAGAASAWNARRQAMVTDLWLFGLAEDRAVVDIQRDVDGLGPEHCERVGCARGDTHPAH